jgi:hypothetical protein
MRRAAAWFSWRDGFRVLDSENECSGFDVRREAIEGIESCQSGAKLCRRLSLFRERRTTTFDLGFNRSTQQVG